MLLKRMQNAKKLNKTMDNAYPINPKNKLWGSQLFILQWRPSEQQWKGKLSQWKRLLRMRRTHTGPLLFLQFSWCKFLTLEWDISRTV